MPTSFTWVFSVQGGDPTHPHGRPQQSGLYSAVSAVQRQCWRERGLRGPSPSLLQAGLDWPCCQA